jgi:hypothetical protein
VFVPIWDIAKVSPSARTLLRLELLELLEFLDQAGEPPRVTWLRRSTSRSRAAFDARFARGPFVGST